MYVLLYLVMASTNNCMVTQVRKNTDVYTDQDELSIQDMTRPMVESVKEMMGLLEE